MKPCSAVIYLCTPMTGYTGREMWEKSIKRSQVYEHEGITVLNPVANEGIEFTDGPLKDRSDAEALPIWKKKDKRQIKAAHVLVVPADGSFSQGVTKEYMLGRGVWFKPTVWIYTNGIKPGFISRTEDDYCATSDQEAAMVIRARWGTRPKRVWWRLKMLFRSLPKWIWDQLGEFK